MFVRFFTCIVWLGGAVWAQTKIQGPLQFRSPDFANQTFSRPWPVGQSLPVACRVGEVYFLDSPTLGRKLYLCSNANQWIEFGQAQGSSSSASQASDLLDFSLLKISSNQIRVGQACSIAKPCRALIGNKVLSVSNSSTISLSGPPSSGQLLIWLAADGIHAGHSVSGIVSCSTGCTVHPNTTAFPLYTVPLAAIPFTANVFDEITPAHDQRAFLGVFRLEPGPSGNIRTQSSGLDGGVAIDLSPDVDLGGLNSTRVTRRGTLAERPPSCAVGELYYQTDSSPGLYHCPGNSQWAATGGGGVTVELDEALVGNRAALNFVAGSGASIVCADDGGAGKVTCTFQFDSSELNTTYARLGSQVNAYAAGHVSDFRAATRVWLPASPGAAPVEAAALAYDTSTNTLKFGNGGASLSLAHTGQLYGSALQIQSPGALNAGVASFAAPGLTGFDGTENNRTWMPPADGTAADLVVRTSSGQPGSGAMSCSLRKNGTASGVSVDVPAGAAAGVFHSASLTAGVALGELLSIRCVNSASTASAAISHISLRVR